MNSTCSAKDCAVWAKIIASAVSCCVCAGMLFAGNSPTPSLTTKEIVQGILARSEAVLSGQLRYHQESAFPGEKPKGGEFQVTFSGASWRLDSKFRASDVDVKLAPSVKNPKIAATPLQSDLELVNLSHHGKSLDFQRTPQPDGSIRNSAAIATEKPIDSSFPSPPVFAGSFWFPSTKEFLRQNIDKALRKPVTDVNGVKAELLEWNVPASEKFKAFHGINNLTKNGGILRLFVSPQLGYVLPRIQFLGQADKVQASFDCSDFVECTDGIFIPKRVSLQYYDAEGPGVRITYQISEAKKINEPIPDSDFVLQLPVGTHIYDGRSGKESTYFELKPDGPIPKELEDTIAVESPAFWGRNWPTALVLGFGVGLALLGFYLAIGRYVLRRRKT